MNTVDQSKHKVDPQNSVKQPAHVFIALTSCVVGVQWCLGEI